jgi:Zn-dependent membrane protease YugP
VSLIGIALVLMFIFGTFSVYTTFSDVDSSTNLTGVNVTKTEICDESGNQCLHLNGTIYMPFAYLTYDKTGEVD